MVGFHGLVVFCLFNGILIPIWLSFSRGKMIPIVVDDLVNFPHTEVTVGCLHLVPHLCAVLYEGFNRLEGSLRFPGKMILCVLCFLVYFDNFLFLFYSISLLVTHR